MTRCRSRLPAHLLSGDLLFGGRAIAEHLGVRNSTVVRLVRVNAIPWFSLDGVACARKSTLAAHFSALEAERRP